MKYILSKLNIGTGKLSDFFSFESDNKISDICFIKDFGYVFSFPESHFLGKISKDLKEEIPFIGYGSGYRDGTSPLFEFPSSICYRKRNNDLIIVEKGGSRIRQYDLGLQCCGTAFGNSVYKKIEKYFVNIKDRMSFHTSCCSDSDGNIYWAIREMNCIFRSEMGFSDFCTYMGTFKYGFSFGNLLSECMVAYPSSLYCHEKSIYFADEGNGCIRKNGKVEIGHPQGEENIRKIIIIGNNAYYLDGNKVKYFSFKSKAKGDIFQREGIFSLIDVCGDLVVIHEE